MTAFGAVCLVVVAAGVIAMYGRSAARRWAPVATLTILLVVAFAGWRWYPAHRNDPAAFSFETRMALSRAGVSMAADHPFFGVGLGRFYALSNEYAGDLPEVVRTGT